MRIGLIGSTGIKIDLLTDHYKFETIDVDGKPFKFYRGTVGSKEIILTARNQYNGSVPPHEVDEKLIMKGMKMLQPDAVVGTAIVGSLSLDIMPGSYVVMDQFLDFTKKTPNTIYDGDEFAFVDFSEPFCPVVRQTLIHACQNIGVTFRPRGCYVGVNGPRYETNAEVRMFAMLGGDVVGMTNVTETIFARELGLCYGTVALVSNYGAGLGGTKEVTIGDIHVSTMENLDHTVDILRQFINLYTGEKTCDCQMKIREMLKKGNC